MNWVQQVRESTVEAHAEEWRQAIRTIHSLHSGLQLVPQVGLVPLGRNSQSGLYEFYMPRSGKRPTWDATLKTHKVDGGSGIVLVLLPGGTVMFGSQRSDERSPHYCATAPAGECPPQTVALAPFLISKFELTQGQWLRLHGTRPSRFAAGGKLGPWRWTLQNPVESIDWKTTDAVLRRAGLAFPTEAQWEYACRSGQPTSWWCGNERKTLLRRSMPVANIADGFERLTTHQRFADSALWPEYNDGHFAHAPVGSFVPNRFGLFDMHGNVAEWCRGTFGLYGEDKMRSGDGQWASIPDDDPRTNHRVVRGGNFARSAEEGRSARRRSVHVTSRHSDVGVRPIWVLRGKKPRASSGR